MRISPVLRDARELNGYEDFKDDTFLDDATKGSGNLLTKIQGSPRYVQYKSFGGWYLPIEPWNFKEGGGRTKRLRDHYLIPLSKACKAVADKPVALSCYTRRGRVWHEL